MESAPRSSTDRNVPCIRSAADMSERIYLDNAATSWPKPGYVYEAVNQYQRENGAPGSRGGYTAAGESDRIIARAREGLARLIGTKQPEQVIFTASGTDSLNLAILGLLQPGDHVVATVCEHNSVLRPLRFLADSGVISTTLVPCDAQGYVSPEDVRRALTPTTRLVATTHASNVTGAVQPIAEIGEIARESGAVYLVDAAQTLGHQPIDVEAASIDLLAAPAHKGLLAPLGLGVLFIRSGLESQLRPVRFGGTGLQSESATQPETMPAKFEAGNHNLPAIAGLGAALRFIAERGIESLASHDRQLRRHLLAGLTSIPGLELFGPDSENNRTSVFSFTLNGYDPQELAAILDATSGIQCRAGLHCAPRMHEALGTLDRGGTVRLSPGWATTTEQLDRALEAIASVAAVMP